MEYDKQKFLNMLASGLCSKGRLGKRPPVIYLAASQWNTVWPGQDGCLTLSAAEPFTLGTYSSEKKWDGSLYYSVNLATWTEWDGTEISSAQHGGKQRIYICGKGNSVITGGYQGKWTLTGNAIECSGNVETLLDYEEVRAGRHPAMERECYSDLFADCSGLVTAPELPATTLATSCYTRMFARTGLVTAPALPATTLAASCYSVMFSGCTSLVTAPALPATTLAEYCYDMMFNGCDSLVTAPELPATTLAESCYEWMFCSCDSLATAPALPATTLASHCYEEMFRGCTSLATAPALPATTLAGYCYYEMFEDCTSLVTAPELPATTAYDYCYYSMFKGCTSLTTSPRLPATTLASHCYEEMFKGCTSLTTSPRLPATTLAVSCYDSMFYGCTSLVTLSALPAIALPDSCYARMFRNCSKIKISETQTDEYPIPYRIPTSGTGTEGQYSRRDMFTDTGGTFDDWPKINTTYYTSNTVV